MLSTSQEGRGYPAGTMGARFTARGVPAGDEGAPIGLPEAVEVVRPDAVRGGVAHGVRLLRSGRECGVSAHSIVVAQIVSEVRPACHGCKIQYIYNVLGYFQTKNTLN